MAQLTRVTTRVQDNTNNIESNIVSCNAGDGAIERLLGGGSGVPATRAATEANALMPVFMRVVMVLLAAAAAWAVLNNFILPQLSAALAGLGPLMFFVGVIGAVVWAISRRSK